MVTWSTPESARKLTVLGRTLTPVVRVWMRSVVVVSAVSCCVGCPRQRAEARACVVVVVGMRVDLLVGVRTVSRPLRWRLASRMSSMVFGVMGLLLLGVWLGGSVVGVWGSLVR
nr:hypothetical protein [Dermatophilus congolensis]